MEPVRQEREVLMKKILFAASEAVPFIKTGGLADVVGSLPKCFDKEYFDVRVIIPKYLCIKQVPERICTLSGTDTAAFISN